MALIRNKVSRDSVTHVENDERVAQVSGERRTDQWRHHTHTKWYEGFFNKICSLYVRTVMGAASIANIVKSSLGPVGLDKMLVDDIGVRNILTCDIIC